MRSRWVSCHVELNPHREDGDPRALPHVSAALRAPADHPAADVTPGSI